jgi:phosphoglycolate phosphatase
VIESPSYIIFDLDGTLMDSSPGIVHCFQLTLAQWQRSASVSLLRQLIGPPLRHSFRELGFSEGDLDDVVECYRDYYARVGVAEAELYAGIADLLEGLVADGVRVGVATAKRVDFAAHMLKDRGVDQWFDVVAGASLDLRVTEKVQIMDEVLTFWDHPTASTVWMVGDRDFDMRGARHHGVVGVGVTWGFGSVAELTEAGSHFVVESPEELLRLAIGGPTTMVSRGA